MSMESAKGNLSPEQASKVEGIHDFQLRQINSRALKSRAVTVSFEPVLTESSHISTIPRLVYSSDSFEPLFNSHEARNLLGVIEKGNEGEDSAGQSTPSRTPLSQRSSQAKSDGQKPKPTSNYCQVCHERFDEYQEHIKHEVHLKNLKKSQFHSYIQNLIVEYQRGSSKRAKSTGSALRDDSVFSKPKKRIKQGNQKNSTTQANFSIQNVHSTQSTTNSSVALQPVEKRQTLEALKE